MEEREELEKAIQQLEAQRENMADVAKTCSHNGFLLTPPFGRLPHDISEGDDYPQSIPILGYHLTGASSPSAAAILSALTGLNRAAEPPKAILERLS